MSKIEFTNSDEILSNLCKSFEDVVSEMNESADALKTLVNHSNRVFVSPEDFEKMKENMKKGSEAGEACRKKLLGMDVVVSSMIPAGQMIVDKTNRMDIFKPVKFDIPKYEPQELTESTDIRSESFIIKRMKNFKYIEYSKVFQFRKHRKPRYLRRFK